MPAPDPNDPRADAAASAPPNGWGGPFGSWLRFCAALLAGFALCAFVSGLLRHWGDPERYPLLRGASSSLPIETYNPGRHAYETWWKWKALNYGDFSPIFLAAQQYNRDPSVPMYRPEQLTEHSAAFVYSPFTAMLFAPIATEQASLESTANRASLLNHVLALVALGMLGALLFRGESGRARTGPLACFALASILYFPLAMALQLTQAGIWIFFFLTLACFLLDRGRTVGAGLALAIGVSIKPHLVLIPVALWFVPQFPRRFVISAAAGLALTGAASLLYAGWDNCHDYVFETLPTLSAGYSYFRNQGFNGMLLRLFTEQEPSVFNLAEPVPWIKTTASVGALALIGATVLALRRSRPSPVVAFATAVAAVVIASPVCWLHHLVLLAIPLSVAARQLRQTGPAASRRAALALACGLLIGCFFDAGGLENGWPSLFSGLSFYGSLGLLALLATAREPQRSPAL